MTTLRETAQQALETLEWLEQRGLFGDFHGVIDALKAALVEDAMQKFTEVNQELEAALAEPDLSRCPQCGGPADNGHDRSIPPNPYWCTKCMAYASLQDQNTELDRKLAEMERKLLELQAAVLQSHGIRSGDA